MSQLIGIVGGPGTGKSSSVRTLNPESTFIINVLGKNLPFKSSKLHYNEEKKNVINTNNWQQVVEILKGVSANRPDVKTIVIDDAGFIMLTEFFKRSGETGYNKFGEIGQHMFLVLETARTLRDDINVVVMFHEDVELIDGFKPMRSIKTVGKMLSDKFDPQALPTVLLYTDVQETKDGMSYHFITNRVDGIPAKSPMGMFEDLRIPNDLQYVTTKIEEYVN